MPVSFQASEYFTTSILKRIQRHYKTGYFTQAEIAEHFGISVGLVGKAVRIMKENGGQAL